MVLSRWILLALALSCATGCLQKRPVVRLATRTAVAVGYVLDHDLDSGAEDVPLRLKQQIAAALAERNLEVQEVPFADAKFASLKGSPRRFSQLGNVGKDAPLALLVETKAQFYSQLNGQFRWVVSVKLSVGDRKQPDVLTSAFDESAILVYEFEKEPEAVARASHVIAERSGALLDQLLSNADGAPAAAPQSSARKVSDAIYFVMVDRFANGDRRNDGAANPADPAAFHGGDLQGVIDHLDALQALGVGTVWLSPVFQMRTEKFFEWGAYHGYWVEDFTRLEPRFGDRGLLRRLSDELHRRGMKLLLDVVLNHVAMDAPLSRSRPEWFHHLGGITRWDDPQELTTHDVHGLPDLAQEREDVYAFLKETSEEWIRVARPDGFRLDAVKHVPLAFWSRFNDDMRRAGGRDFVLLGELLDGDVALLAKTEREGHFSAMFDFPLYFALIDVFCRDRSPTRLAATLSSDRQYDDPLSLVTLLDNHDLPRVLTDCGGDVERVKRALAFQLTARGAPALTYGTEAGLTGEREPQSRGDMKFDARHPLQEEITRLLALRVAHPVLVSGASKVLAADDGLFAYARLTPDEAAVVAVNPGTSVRSVKLEGDLAIEGVWTDASGRRLSGGTLEVAPKSVVIAFLQVEKGALKAATGRAQTVWTGRGPKREVEVVVSGAALKEGDTVLLVGSGPELGAWNPEKGKPVQPRSTIALPAGVVFEFKVVVRRASGAVEWEQGGNRTLFVEEGAGAMRVSLTPTLSQTAADTAWERERRSGCRKARRTR